MKNEKVESIWYDLPVKVFLPSENNTKSRHCEWHLHKEVEICLQVERKKIFYIGASTYELNPGDIIIVPEYLPHSTFSFENSKSLLIQYADTSEETENLLSALPFLGNDKAVIISENNSCQKQIADIMRTIATEYKNKDYGCKTAIKSNLKYLTVLFERNGLLPKRINKTSIFDSSEILTHIVQNYRNKITIEDVANKFSFEKSYFCRKFKKSTGFSFISCVNKIRLLQARKMLLNTDLSVESISFECGFNSTSYFIKSFKAEYNVTPHKYRNMFMIDALANKFPER